MDECFAACAEKNGPKTQHLFCHPQSDVTDTCIKQKASHAELNGQLTVKTITWTALFGNSICSSLQRDY